MNTILCLALCFYSPTITSGVIVDKEVVFGGKVWEQTGWYVIDENKRVPWHGWVYYSNRYYITITKFGLRQRLNVSSTDYRRYFEGDYYDYCHESKTRSRPHSGNPSED